MFSSTAEYALRAVVHLAAHRSRLWSSADIAGATQVPPKYLSKVLNDLVRAGVMVSRRGPSGGFTLARPPEQISVLDVVDAVDPLRRIEVCPLGLPEHAHKLCRLHRRLDETIALVQESLRSSSIKAMTEPAGLVRAPQSPTVRGHPAARPGGAGNRSRGR